MTDPVFVTAWLAALLFFISRLKLPSHPAWQSCWPILEAAGVLLLWVHVVVAYGLVHNWSHRAAVEHVAERTQETVGIRSGLGIYANFLVALVWTWSAINRRFASSRLAGLDRQAISIRQHASEAFLWLMFLSATIVFARPSSAVVFSVVAATVLGSRFVRGKHVGQSLPDG